MEDLVFLLLEISWYGTGRLLLPLLTLGRIKVAPLRQPIGKARVLPTKSTDGIVVGEGWATFAGFIIWAALIVMAILFYHLGLV